MIVWRAVLPALAAVETECNRYGVAIDHDFAALVECDNIIEDDSLEAARE